MNQNSKNGLERHKVEGQLPVQSVKIKHLDREAVGDVVLYICAVTGITKDPGDYSAKVTLDFIINKYANYGILEFKTAFDMYVQGKLPKRDNESHFNTISASFIGSVMAKYQTHRIIEMRELEKDNDKPKPKPIHTPETFEAAYNYAVGYIHKENKLPIGGHYVHVYEHFKVSGLGWYGIGKESRIEAKNAFKEIVRGQLKTTARLRNAEGSRARMIMGNKAALDSQCKIKYAKQELNKLIK